MGVSELASDSVRNLISTRAGDTIAFLDPRIVQRPASSWYVSRNLLIGKTGLVYDFCERAVRREESRRGTQECVRHGYLQVQRILSGNSPVLPLSHNR